METWAAHLSRTGSEQGQLRATLSSDELERASRFSYELHANRYIAGRGILRSLISGYLGCEPAAVRFRYEGGKPAILEPSAKSLYFNLAHADDLAVYAFSTEAELGIDVERVAAMSDARDIAARYFSPAEIVEFERAPDEAEAFFRCWTRKEAFIKALGDGLAYPLDTFAVSILADDRAEVRDVGGDRAEAAKWSLRHLEPADGFVGALAARSQITSVDCLRWEPTLVEQRAPRARG